MKNKIGLLIAIILLGYGLIRIGVGGALLAQTLEIVNFSELAEATLEVREFISIRASRQLIPFILTGYFTYILVMGVLLFNRSSWHNSSQESGVHFTVDIYRNACCTFY